MLNGMSSGRSRTPTGRGVSAAAAAAAAAVPATNAASIIFDKRQESAVSLLVPALFQLLIHSTHAS
jgi:hypothetical protein